VVSGVLQVDVMIPNTPSTSNLACGGCDTKRADNRNAPGKHIAGMREYQHQSHKEGGWWRLACKIGAMHDKTLQDCQVPDPRTAGPRPPYAQEKIQHPGLSAAMNPRPNYGEESYHGLGA